AGGVERQTITLPVKMSAGAGAHVEPEVRREMLMLEAARVRRDALERRDRGDFDGAAGSLRELKRRLSEAAPHDAEIRLEADEIGMLAESFAEANVSLADQKYMYQRSYNAMSG